MEGDGDREAPVRDLAWSRQDAHQLARDAGKRLAWLRVRTRREGWTGCWRRTSRGSWGSGCSRVGGWP